MIVDSLGEYEEMPDWNETADVLLGVGLTLNPSELHGVITGMLSAGRSIESEKQYDAALAVLEKSLGVDLQGEVADFTCRTMTATLSAMRDTDFAFQLLLPDDDEIFEHRLLSLGRWSSGFLTGFTQSITVAEQGNSAVQPGTAEAIKDFAAIAQIDVTENESGEGEREFEEIKEYLRIAALNVFMDAFNNMN